MNKNYPLKSWGCATLLLTLNSSRALFGADTAVDGQIINPLDLSGNTLRSLEENKQNQIQAAKAWKAFHDFQFSDHTRRAASALNIAPWTTRPKTTKPSITIMATAWLWQTWTATAGPTFISSIRSGATSSGATWAAASLKISPPRLESAWKTISVLPLPSQPWTMTAGRTCSSPRSGWEMSCSKISATENSRTSLRNPASAPAA